MADRREQIMVRLLEIAVGMKTTDGIVTAQRNKGLLKDDKRPAIVILDGDEQPELQAILPSRHAAMGMSLQTAKPEIYVLLNEYRPNNTDAANVNVGTKLGALRKALVKLIADDATILNILGSNGSMKYLGCITDLKSGSALTGEMRLDFSFTYLFDPRN